MKIWPHWYSDTKDWHEATDKQIKVQKQKNKVGHMKRMEVGDRAIRSHNTYNMV